MFNTNDKLRRVKLPALTVILLTNKPQSVDLFFYILTNWAKKVTNKRVKDNNVFYILTNRFMRL